RAKTIRIAVGNRVAPDRGRAQNVIRGEGHVANRVSHFALVVGGVRTGWAVGRPHRLDNSGPHDSLLAPGQVVAINEPSSGPQDGQIEQLTVLHTQARNVAGDGVQVVDSLERHSALAVGQLIVSDGGSPL